MKATEKNFIKLIKRGKEEGLLYVVDTYGWLIQSVVRKYLFMIPDLQDECINDVLLALWQHIDDFQENKGTFQNWLAGISRFKAIDCKRNYIRNQTKCIAMEQQDTEDEAAFKQMMAIEVREEITDLLRQLSGVEREIFRKYFMEESTIREISDETGYKENTIYQKIVRGRKKLRRYRESMEVER